MAISTISTDPTDSTESMRCDAMDKRPVWSVTLAETDVENSNPIAPSDCEERKQRTQCGKGAKRDEA